MKYLLSDESRCGGPVMMTLTGHKFCVAAQSGFDLETLTQFDLIVVRLAFLHIAQEPFKFECIFT